MEYTISPVAVNSPDFEAVLRLRAAAYGRPQAEEREAIDDYSFHFAAYSAGGIVGAVRATCRMHGALEAECFYPAWLLDEFGNKLSAVSRLCVLPSIVGSRLPHDLTRFAWKVVLPLGIRIDVSKARLEAIPFYMRMGHFFVRNATFNFDRWDARCGFVVCAANPQYGGTFADLFAGISEPCALSQSPNSHQFTRSYREFVQDTNGLVQSERRRAASS